MRFRVFSLCLFAAAAPAAQAQPSGRLISAEPVAGAPDGANAWRISYTSTDINGRSITSTGMVIAPNASGAANRPVLAWTHGTWGVEDQCAPSRGVNFFRTVAGLPDALARGMVVVAPDYEGLGSEGVHPYLVGPSAARSTLDAIRAARDIPEAKAGRHFAVWGESQGGHAALFTGAEAARYAPELRLAAVAAAAPPTDLPANLAGETTPARTFLTAYVMHSWSRYYDIDMKRTVRPSTAGIIDRLAQNNCVSLDAKPKLGMALGVAAVRSALKNVNIATRPPWSTYARQNSAPVIRYSVPLFIAQSIDDPLVNAQITRRHARKLCRAGNSVTYVALPGGRHETSAADSATATLNWISDRFAGRSATSDCVTLK